MELFDTFPFTNLRGKNRGLDWVVQKVSNFQKRVDNIPAVVSATVSEEVRKALSTLNNSEPSRNLLDNSNFKNHVNQRKQKDGVVDVNKFAIDRWCAVDGNINISFGNGGISIERATDGVESGICQRFAFTDKDFGKHYTFAVKTSKAILTATGQLTEAASWTWVARAENADIKIKLGRYANNDLRMRADIIAINPTVIEWAALYEGEYNAETLPEYQPKGYAEELAECRRYYCRLDTTDGGVYGVVLQGVITSGNKDIILALPITTMRIARPTATLSGGVILRGISGYIENSDSGISVSLATLGNGVGHNIRVNKTDGTVFSVNAVNNTPVSLSLSAGSYMELSADL